MRLSIGLVAGLVVFSAHAEKFSFQTPYDHFEFSTGPKGGFCSGKRFDPGVMAEGLNALTSPLGTDCPHLNGKPDITARVGAQTRMVYLKQGLVTDGKACLTVAGDGLFYLPLHRDFLAGPARDSIKLKSPLKVFRQGVKILSLHKKGDKWTNDAAEQMLDWDFIERFENSLSDFGIRLRVQDGITKDKSKMLVQSGDHTYEFYKITDKMWAVKKPGARWLEASDDWTEWYDFDAKILEDRYAGQIEFIQDTSKDKDSRLSALTKLESSWSPNLRELYHKMVLDPNEDPELQDIAMKRLKRKPSPETAGVMIKVLEESKNNDLKREAGVILKTQNPKGPKFNPSATPEEQQKTLEFWRSWWRQNQKAP